ncbi:MAG: hypothetical protein INR73_26520 [Williamsia sp.]|nr:hypothetical protein [Williamsia sp.]
MAAGSPKKRRNKTTQLSLFSAEDPVKPHPEPEPPPVPSSPTPPFEIPPPAEGIRKEIIELRKKELIAKFKKQTEAARAARKNLNKENN